MNKPEIKFWQATVMRNASWPASIRIMLIEGVWGAPYALFALVGPSIEQVFMGLLSFVLCSLLWVFGLVSMIVLGLLGLLSPVLPKNRNRA